MRRAVVRAWLVELARPEGARTAAPAAPLRPDERDRVCELAGDHGVLPAVLSNLPTAEAAPWRERLVAQAGMSLAVRAVAGETIAALAEAGVPHIVLKGPEFADRLYDRPELRSFTDLDLLVPRSGVPAAEAVLEGMGYAAEASGGHKHAGGYGERSWTRPDRPGVTVELHWNVVNSPALQRGVSVEFADLQREETPGARGRPSAASLLLIAAVHGATGHGFDRLQILCDVRQAARGVAGAMDEDWLVAAAQRTGGTLSLAVALDLCGRVFREPVGESLARRLGRTLPARLARILLTRATALDAPLRPSLRRQAFRELLKRR